jgi:hypothetical protein
MPEPYTAQFFPDDTWVIGDEEYGFNALRVTLLEWGRKLLDDEKHKLIEKIKGTVEQFRKDALLN